MLLTARFFTLEINCCAIKFLVTLLPVILGAVRLPLNMADGTFLNLIHCSLRVGDCTGYTSSDTTCCANNTTNGPKSSIKRNSKIAESA